MDEKKLSIKEQMMDLPMPLNDKEKFQNYFKDYFDIYDEEPDYKSEKYCQFLIAMQLIRLNDNISSLNYIYRKNHDQLSEEELENAKKIKKFWDSL